MIEIICGEFGFKDGDFITVKTVNDPPFNAPSEVEKRLVESGIARYVEDTVDNNIVDGPCYDESTSFNDLKAIAIKLGATKEDLKGKNSKVLLRELIDSLVKPDDNTTPDDDNNDESEGETDGEDTPDDNDENSSENDTTEDGEDEGPDLGNDDGVVD